MRIAEPVNHSELFLKQPTSPRWRIFKAYITAAVVIASYLWQRFLTRFRSATTIEEKIDRANKKNAQRIHRAISELQGLYIKVGQLFSIMTNFLPEAFRSELEGLQDKVPPRSYKAIERRFKEEFDGRGPKDLFEAFDETPIASASIGQVHIAQLHGGIRVAVKVQYPDIDRIVRSDLRALRRIIGVIEKFFPYQGLNAVYHEMRAIILDELDFTHEAQNVERIACHFVDQTEVHFPKVIWEYSSKRVLTTEYIEGVKVNDRLGLDRLQVNRTDLARLIIETYCKQIFNHGLYHADPHPGNILVQGSSEIAFVDFGAVAQVSDAMRRGILTLLQGAINRDTGKIVDALRDMGFIAHKSDPIVYERVVNYFHSRFQDEIKLESFSLKDIKFDPKRGLENLADLRTLNISLKDITSTFHVPKEWIMLERTILLLMGLCTELDPHLNPMEVIRPHVEEFVLGKGGDWSQFLLDTARDLTVSTLALPQEIKKFTGHAIQGDLSFHQEGTKETARLYYALGHQLIYTALAIASFSFGLYYDSIGKTHVYQVCTVASGGFVFFLLWSLRKTRKLLKKFFELEKG